MARKPAFTSVTGRDFDFTAAPIYRKTATLRADRVEISRTPQPIVTRIGKLEETRNIAQKGDRIITGAQGERWVIKAKDFPKLYGRDPKKPGQFVSKSRVRAVKLNEGVELTAPWGEKQRAKKGGYVVQRVGAPRHVYLIEELAFKKTYRREKGAASEASPKSTARKPAVKRHKQRANARG
jgi:hypothetical protein